MIPPDISPDDPRTWLDWTNPSDRGFQKVDCEIGLERVLNAAGTACVILAGWWSWMALVGHPAPDHPWSVLNRPAYLGPVAMLCLAGVLFTARYLTDNFYLVDPARHVVYYHFRFLFVRRVRLLFERRDLLGVSTQTRKRRTRYSSWWEHRVVLIGTTGRVVPLDRWRRDALWRCNQEAAALATSLGCAWYEAQEGRRVIVTVKDGVASVAHARPGWLEGYAAYPIFALTLIALLLVMRFMGLIR